MENRRKLIRIDVKDFLELRPINNSEKISKVRSENFSLMGICFSCGVEWRQGQLLYIDYFLPDEADSVQLKARVIWSEFVNDKEGFFCGAEIIDVEPAKQDKFANYYFQKLRDMFFE